MQLSNLCNREKVAMRSKTLTVIGIIVGAIVLVIGGVILLARPAGEHPWFRADDPDMLVIAHQGGERVWPSNTMYAYQHAVDIGADALEMDVHMTADSVLALMHDDTVDRTTDGSGAIRDMTWAEIAALDAGHYWTDDGGATYPYRGQGIVVPRLDEVFEAFPDTRMVIEIKPDDAAIVGPFCDLIRESGMEEQVMVGTFHSRPMRAFRAACPEVATSATQNEGLNFFILETLLLGPAYSPQTYALQVPEYYSGLHVVTSRFVKAAHRRGMDVHVWTVNEIADMERLIGLGVDGIITDRPDRLIELLGR
jgi:glycerophosphoryl diester phosphodiesterase